MTPKFVDSTDGQYHFACQGRLLFNKQYWALRGYVQLYIKVSLTPKNGKTFFVLTYSP